MKTPEQLAAFHQDNVAALVTSGEILAGGVQEMSAHFASDVQAAMVEAASVWRAMAGVRTLPEALALQGSFARTSIEKGLADTHRLAESGLRVAEQAAAPISARLTAAAAVFTQAA